MIISEVIKRLQGFNQETACAYDLWLPEDVRQQAEHEERYDLTDEQCAEVLKFVQHHNDATLGINWDTLSFAIDEVLGSKHA